MYGVSVCTHTLQAAIRAAAAAGNGGNVDNEALNTLLNTHQQYVQQLNCSLDEQRQRQMQMLRERFERLRSHDTKSTDVSDKHSADSFAQRY